MKPIVLWGSSGQAIVLTEFLPSIGYRLIALFDNDKAVASISPSVPIYYGSEGFSAWLISGKPWTRQVFGLAAIGGDRGIDRADIHRLFRESGIVVAVAVHPSAYIARDAVVGVGTQVLARATVGSRVNIGADCILNTACSVDHECQLSNGVHIGPGAHLAGCVEIGQHSFVGMGAVVLPRVRVGCDTTIGAGAVVTSDVPDRCICFGSPARVRRYKD